MSDTIHVGKAVEDKDGSTTIPVMMSNETWTKVNQLGIEFIVYCTVYGLDIQEAFDVLRDYAEARDSDD